MKKKIVSEKAPAAIGPYSQGIEVNGFVYVSGQIPVDRATGAIPEGVAAQTEQVLKNVSYILAEAGCTMDDVVKTTVFLSDMGDFAPMNEVYAKHFTGEVMPARAAVESPKLVKGVLVEIDAIAVKK